MSGTMMIARGGGNQIGKSKYDYYFPCGTGISIDCGIQPTVRQSDIDFNSLQPASLERYIRDERLRRSENVINEIPDLSMPHQINAVFLTHAHADHVATLPLLLRDHRHLSAYATEETIALCKMQLFQTIQIAKRNHTEPLFSLEDYHHTMRALKVVQSGHLMKVNDHVSVMPIHAGHILGAVSYIIHYDGKPIGFHSGDLCGPQRTIMGADPYRPVDGLQFMTIDSTRLIEKNPPRAEEEDLLMNYLRDAVNRGIKVRLLVFAIGRLQEGFALAREACPNTPIWIEGMGKEVSAQYEEYGANNIEGITNHFVNDRDQRDRIIRNNDPSIVLIPSAMMFGGTARFYLDRGIGQDDHSFVSLGYLDHCSPEFAFFESNVGSVFHVGRYNKIRRCETRRYNLTAHCDGHDIVEMKSRMRPDNVILVHGENLKMDTFISDHPNEGYIKGENGKEIQM